MIVRFTHIEWDTYDSQLPRTVECEFSGAEHLAEEAADYLFAKFGVLVLSLRIEYPKEKT